MFKFVDEIMWCYHSNETSFAEPLHSATVKAHFTDTCWRPTLLSQTVFFVPGEKAWHFLYIQSIWYEHPVNTDIFYGPFSVYIKGV